MLTRIQKILALLRNPAIPRLPKFIVGLAVLYMLLPTDLVPDVPVIGWIDDITFLWIALSNLFRKGATAAPAPDLNVTPGPPPSPGPTRSNEPPASVKGPIIDVTPES